MSSTTAASRTRWYIPTSRHEQVYAAMTGVLTVGIAGIAAYSGAPSLHWGMMIVLAAAVLLGVGGAYERDGATILGAVVGGLTGYMVVVTSATERAYSHRTLAGMFLSVVAVLLTAARFMHMAERARRAGR